MRSKRPVYENVLVLLPCRNLVCHVQKIYVFLHGAEEILVIGLPRLVPLHISRLGKDEEKRRDIRRNATVAKSQNQGAQQLLRLWVPV